MKHSKKNVLSNRLLFFVLIPLSFGFTHASVEPVIAMTLTAPAVATTVVKENNESKIFIYDSLQLDDLGLSKQAFIEGLKGYNYLRSEGKLDNDSVISIVDFSLSSTQKRLFVIDLQNNKLLFNTYVAHGRNSGKEYATRFSNKPRSHMSSLGFYITEQTYYGENGLSLRLEGEEKGINDNAESRAIVIHPADYATEKAVEDLGYLGRSYGCPALPPKLAASIIQTIKEGSCFFVYSKSKKYKLRSSLLQ